MNKTQEVNENRKSSSLGTTSSVSNKKDFASLKKIIDWDRVCLRDETIKNIVFLHWELIMFDWYSCSLIRINKKI